MDAPAAARTGWSPGSIRVTACERSRSPGCTAASRVIGASASSARTAQFFRYAGPGTLVAREAASAPRTATRPRDPAHPAGALRAAAVDLRRHHRAAVEEEGAGDLQLRRDQLVGIRHRGDPARAGARRRRARCCVSLPIAIAIALLLAIVSISYRQEIYAYPSGGGDYAVARANLPAHLRADRRRRAARRLHR